MLFVQYLKIEHLALTFATICIGWLLSNRYLTPLRKVPGPFWASCSRIPRFFAVLVGRPHEWELGLHQKYGPLVRVGPDLLSVGDCAEMDQIYGTSTKFRKSSFYLPFMVYDAEGLLPDPLVLSNKALHTRMKRNAYNAYSMNAMVELEPLVDGVTERFFRLLDKFCEAPREACDLGKWVRFYATDVIFMVTFGSDLSFMENGDPIGMMPILEYVIGDYTGIVGQMPWLHKFLLGNRFVAKLLLGNNGLDGAALELAQAQVEKLRNDLKDEDPCPPLTFVHRLLQNQKVKPSSITDRELHTHAFGNITAGADTTAIVLRTILFNVTKNTKIYDSLCREIRDEAKLTLPVSFRHANSLPYLNAVIKEALRIHPPNGLMYCRTVPEDGATICGYYIPANTEVGISPWVLHYDPILFPQPEKFEPGRWLSPDTELVARRNRSLFAFSAGAHTCSGKNFSLMEMTKLVPSLLLRYEIELVNPRSAMSFKCRWFTPQTGLLVRLKERNG
ncbi:uncharacterized protein A1O5_05003 [Cladophialophora psammophila CBS 110553]|uniref:Cytochrome P450 oxidoreductase n=1 Tax=Cladophialophora psammophila CBS 110553 TaxID=1182543 RepID=W9WX34_9EURO|nr:uncharacterized protein A1O5_05003 [Cladophialophora psammophila CBS 110553]EXJ72498.1 hypothetical protein A1O5_05003 [Cladophialophora psammophila CBS 110553]